MMANPFFTRATCCKRNLIREPVPALSKFTPRCGVLALDITPSSIDLKREGFIFAVVFAEGSQGQGHTTYCIVWPTYHTGSPVDGVFMNGAITSRVAGIWWGLKHGGDLAAPSQPVFRKWEEANGRAKLIETRFPMGFQWARGKPMGPQALWVIP